MKHEMKNQFISLESRESERMRFLLKIGIIGQNLRLETEAIHGTIVVRNNGLA